MGKFIQAVICVSFVIVLLFSLNELKSYSDLSKQCEVQFKTNCKIIAVPVYNTIDIAVKNIKFFNVNYRHLIQRNIYGC